ncbi:prespore vesicle protein-like [Penaeus indicus]|uniref:prespore vesicle protein-like n=1 Tax=Penaeus indicus TaxID=29960 RepID=UPI00300CC23F
MRILVVLAVLGVCSASLQQAYNHGYNYVQPRYVGPLASTVPAGVDGTITPVSDTYEVAAARGAFFRAYQDQLATVNALRYGAPATHHAVHHSAPAVHQNAQTVHHNTPAVHNRVPAVHHNVDSVHHSAPTVHHNAPAVHHNAPTVHNRAPTVHHNVAVHHSAPAVHHNAPAAHHRAPTVHHNVAAVSQSLPAVPDQVRDTPEVSAAKAEFFRLYNQQAAAAAAAPDHHAVSPY